MQIKFFTLFLGTIISLVPAQITSASTQEAEKLLPSQNFNLSSKTEQPLPLSEQIRFLNGEWIGTYSCAQGITSLKLTIFARSVSDITAIFSFSAHPSNPSVPSGSFRMIGSYSPPSSRNISGQLTFNGGEWINRPTGYITVDLQGLVFFPESRIIGNVLTQGCSSFDVRKSR